jgi:hypothetical protein
MIGHRPSRSAALPAQSPAVVSPRARAGIATTVRSFRCFVACDARHRENSITETPPQPSGDRARLWLCSFEAVVGLTVSIAGGCGWLNGFPILNALPVWPGCVPVRLTGDIVRRRNISP